MLQVLVELIFRWVLVQAADERTWEALSFSVPMDVSLQLELIVEECWTQAARVLPTGCDFSFDRDSVSAQVMVELCYRVKLFWALTANVLLDLVMCLHVIVEVGNLSEGTTAVWLDANEWSLACVQSPVIVEVCNLSESFSAIDTKIRQKINLTKWEEIHFKIPDVGAIICVNSLMISQVGLLGESFLAVSTNVLLVSRMISNMIQQGSFTVENLLAKGTSAFFPQKYFPVHVDECLFEFKG